MKVLAGVVLYNPPTSTYSLLKNLKSQGCMTSVFVNALQGGTDISVYSQLSDFYLSPGENIGLANGLNAIIRTFQSEAFDYLFLFDQDSQIGDSYVPSMIHEYILIASNDSSIVCLAPRLADIKSSYSYASPKSLVKDQSNIQLFTTAATSGCLFMQNSFSEVGCMDQNLFIDGIDHDWCLRAWINHCSIYFSTKTILSHNMGDSFIKYGSSLKPIHSNPIRHYYIVRNSIYMILWKSFPNSWSLVEGFKTIRRIVGYPLLSEKKLLSLKMVALGAMHGILKQMGKLSSISH